jgi:hypothetical protein
MYVIFTGGNYWAMVETPGTITGDFKIVSGLRWVKSKKQFSGRWKLFPCPKHYQLLTKQEVKAQLGLD